MTPGDRARTLARELGLAMEERRLDWAHLQDGAHGLPEIIEAAIQAAVLEEQEAIATFVETHYCVMDPVRAGRYITEERPKHPCEPLAAAIRARKL
jgi:hypothetical protein